MKRKDLIKTIETFGCILIRHYVIREEHIRDTQSRSNPRSL